MKKKEIITWELDEKQELEEKNVKGIEEKEIAAARKEVAEKLIKEVDVLLESNSLVLDLSRRGIDDELLSLIFAHLKREKKAITITELILKGNALTEASGPVIAEFIKWCGNLIKLDLSSNAISDHPKLDGVKVLIEAVRNSKSLASLKLSSNKLTAASKDILRDLLIANENLRELYLGRNTLGDSGVSVLAQGLKGNKALINLRLWEVGMTASGASALIGNLGDNSALQELGLGFNELGNKGAVIIAEYLRANKSLQRLYLWNCNIGNRGLSALAAVLSGSSLQCLELAGNVFDDIRSAELINSLRGNTSLAVLNLACNEIGDVSAEVLKEGLLEELPTLTHVDLEYTQVKKKDFNEIKTYLSNNHKRAMQTANKKALSELKELYQQTITNLGIEEEKERSERMVLACRDEETMKKLAEIKADLSAKEKLALELMQDSNWDFVFIAEQISLGAKPLHLGALLRNTAVISALLEKRIVQITDTDALQQTVAAVALTQGWLTEFCTRLVMDKEQIVGCLSTVAALKESYGDGEEIKNGERQLKLRKNELEFENRIAQGRSRDLTDEARNEQERELIKKIKIMCEKDVISASAYNLRKEIRRLVSSQQSKDEEQLLLDMQNTLKEIKHPWLLLDFYKQGRLREIVFGGSLSLWGTPLLFSNITALCTRLEKFKSKLISFDGDLAEKDKKYSTIIKTIEEIIDNYNNYIQKVCAASVEERKKLYEPKIIIQGEDVFGYLKPEYAQELLKNLPVLEEAKEESNPEKSPKAASSESGYGTHTVKKINEVFYKFRPHAPGVEFMVDSLNKIIAGYLSAPTRLLCVKDSAGKNYPFQASMGIAGIELQYLVESRMDLVREKIDPKNFSSMIVLSLLTDPSDGKPDNYMVEPIGESRADAVGKLRIVGIDNDLAFAEQVLKIKQKDKKREEHMINVRNALYFFPQMEEIVDREFCAKFVEKLPEIIIIEWLSALYKQDVHYRQLLDDGIFSKADYEGNHLLSTDDHGMRLPLKFRPGTVNTVYEKLQKMHNLMQGEGYLTHRGLFAEIEPIAANYYAAVQGEIYRAIAEVREYGADAGLKIKEEENAINAEIAKWEKYKTEKDYAQKLGILYHKRDIIALKQEVAKDLQQGYAVSEIIECNFYGLYKPAANVLENYISLMAARQRGDTSEMTRSVVKTGHAFGFEAERTQDVLRATEEFVANIDFSKLDAKSEELILLRIASDLKFIEDIEINGARSLDDRNLIEFTGRFGNLKSLTLKRIDEVKPTTVLSLLDDWKEGKKSERKIIIEDCAKLNIDTWQRLARAKYENVYVRADGKELCLGQKDEVTLLFEFASAGKFNKAFYDYVFEKTFVAINVRQKGALSVEENKEVSTTVENRSILHMACAAGNIRLVEYLLTKEADIWLQDSNGYTPLHIVCKEGQNTTLVEMLLNKQLEKGEDKITEYINIPDASGETVLDTVVRSGNQEIVELLQRHGGVRSIKEEIAQAVDIAVVAVKVESEREHSEDEKEDSKLIGEKELDEGRRGSVGKFTKRLGEERSVIDIGGKYFRL